MDQRVKKRVRRNYHTNEMQKSEIKVKKFTQDSQVDAIIHEQNNSSNETEIIFQERENATFISECTDQEPTGDPLQLYSDSPDDSETHTNSDGDINESDDEESGQCNEQNSVDLKELEDILNIKEWVISCSVPHAHVNKLLKILKDRLLPSIPLDVETLLKFNELGHHKDVKNNVSVPVIDASKVQCKSDFETFVLAQLVLQHSNMQRIENKLDNFVNFLPDKKVCSSKRSFIDFKTKYNLSFPINEKHLFMIFDVRLKSDKLLQNDVCAELSICIDKDYSVSKTYLAMIRAFITKNVAMQYTASRPSRENSKSKDIFKSTQFYECMEGVFLSARNKTSLTTTNSELMSSLSDVLSNVKKWNEKKWT